MEFTGDNPRREPKEIQQAKLTIATTNHQQYSRYTNFYIFCGDGNVLDTDNVCLPDFRRLFIFTGKSCVHGSRVCRATCFFSGGFGSGRQG
jgi:hypothetical protein